MFEFDERLPARKISSEQEAMNFLNEFENIDVNSVSRGALFEYIVTSNDLIIRFAENKDIAEKTINVIDKYIEKIDPVSVDRFDYDFIYYNTPLGMIFTENACICTLSSQKNNDELAEKWFKISEKMKNIGSGNDQEYGLSGRRIKSHVLFIYNAIIDNNPHNDNVSKKILDNFITHSVSNYSSAGEISDEDYVKNLVKKIVGNSHDDEECLETAMKFVNKQLESVPAEVLEYKGYDYSEYMRGRYHECLYEKDIRFLPVLMAERNTSKPQIVEKCLEMCESYGDDYRSMIYGKLAIAGYAENNFNDRYADKLNKGEIIFHDGKFAAIKNVADKLNVDVLRQAAMQAGNQISHEKYKANKWHRDAYLSSENYQDKEDLARLADEKIKQEAIAEAKSKTKQPSLIYIEEYAGDRYGAWAERVYIKDEKGDYQATNIVDDLYWGNARSSAREQVEDLNNMLAVEHGVYRRNGADEDFSLLEYNPAYNYRVLSENAYWRDDISNRKLLATSGAYEGSTLVSKNPVSGKFEDVDFAVDYCQGDYLQATNKKEDGVVKTTIYKRNEKDGKFYPDAEFPAGEYLGGGYGKEGVYSISFMTYQGDKFTYLSDERGSVLAKRNKGDECFSYVDRFSNLPHKNEEHKQRPFEDIKELLVKKKKMKTESGMNSAYRERGRAR